MLLKDRNAYKHVLRRGLTSLLDPVEDKASSAAKPSGGTDAGAAGPGTVLVLVLLLLLSVLVLVLVLLLQLLLLQLLLQVSKTHPSPQQNTMLVKDGNVYKNVLRRGLTPLLNPVENKANSAAKPPACADAGSAGPGTGASPAIAAVGPGASAGPAAAAVAASLENALLLLLLLLLVVVVVVVVVVLLLLLLLLLLLSSLSLLSLVYDIDSHKKETF